jgi:hypothetical protein
MLRPANTQRGFIKSSFESSLQVGPISMLVRFGESGFSAHGSLGPRPAAPA